MLLRPKQSVSLAISLNVVPAECSLWFKRAANLFFVFVLVEQ
jgi:hypothetical protein